MVYRVLIEKGEDFGYVAHCPAIPGCHSQGDTIEEAIENIKDAIKSCIEALDKDLLFQRRVIGIRNRCSAYYADQSNYCSAEIKWNTTGTK